MFADMRYFNILMIVFTVAFFSLSQKASALSCVEFTADMIVDLVSRQSPVIVVQGDLIFDGAFVHIQESPKSAAENGVHHSIQGQVRGVDVATGAPFHGDVDIEQHCLGPWCGHAVPMEGALLLLDKRDGRYVLPLMACSGRIFKDFSVNNVADIRACFENKACQSYDADSVEGIEIDE